MEVRNVTSINAAEMLKDDDSVLIDVRTPEEWGVTAPLSLNANDVVFLSLMTSPDMSMNPRFIDDFMELELDPAQKLLFVCKAGGRSGYAAEMCASLGYECYNITDGIDGLVSAMIAASVIASRSSR